MPTLIDHCQVAPGVVRVRQDVGTDVEVGGSEHVGVQAVLHNQLVGGHKTYATHVIPLVERTEFQYNTTLVVLCQYAALTVINNV